MKTIAIIVGARPNFVKAAALCAAAVSYSKRVKIEIIHTGQHYSDELSTIFFEQFNMPKLYANLNIGSNDRITTTHLIMERLTNTLKELKPDMVVVIGDVTSTVAAAMTAVSLGIPVAHVEAGLRSRNWRMNEEVNRVMVDHISSLLFATEVEGVMNLQKEGVDMSRVYLVGNTMIDTLNLFEGIAENSSVLERLQVLPYSYVLATLHRAENVDDVPRLLELYGALCDIHAKCPVILPLHPRTKLALERAGVVIDSRFSPIIVEPQSYLDFFKLQRYARCIVTDSGGIQEEASVIGVPVLTVRTETERPITIEYGTNEMVGVSREKIGEAATRALKGQWKRRKAVIPFWDGKAGERIMAIIDKALHEGNVTMPEVIAQTVPKVVVAAPPITHNQDILSLLLEKNKEAAR